MTGKAKASSKLKARPFLSEVHIKRLQFFTATYLHNRPPSEEI